MSESNTTAGDDTKSKIIIPDEVKEKFPELVPQVLESKSMDDEERNYWFSVLPIMTDEQVDELRDILKSEKKRTEKTEEKEVDAEKAAEKRREKREERRKKEISAREEDHEMAEDLLAELEI